MPAPDKIQILALLQQRLASSLDALTESQRAVQAGAVHPEAKQEHPKDTRAIEAGYLARGLAERVETLRDGLRALALLRVRPLGDDDVATPGAMVTIETDGGDEAFCLLAPAGGGETFTVDGRTVLVLTPHSPLGAALAGRRAGDAVEAELPSGRFRADILRVE